MSLRVAVLTSIALAGCGGSHDTGADFAVTPMASDLGIAVVGEGWTSRTSGTAGDLVGVVARAGAFVAVGSDSSGATILHSSDGSTWSAASLPPSTPALHAVTASAAPDEYVAVGEHGTILTSTDAATWTARPIGQQIVSLAAVGALAPGLVALGDEAVFTSSEGTTWTQRMPGLDHAGLNSLQGTAKAGQTTFVVGELTMGNSPNTQTTGIVYGTSDATDDSRSWSRLYENGPSLLAVAHDAERVIAVGELGTVVSSAGTTSFASTTIDESYRLSSVASCGGQYVVVGSDTATHSGAVFVASSAGTLDAGSWTKVAEVNGAGLYGVACTGTTIVAVGAFGTILSGSL